MRKMFSALIAVIGLSFGMMAQSAELGPAVGSQIPVPLETVDLNGDSQSYDSLKGEKGAILVFFRSADWCPFCQRQLIDLMTIDSAAQQRGYQIIGISYDSPAKLKKFASLREVRYPLLSDTGSEIIDAFGIRNTAYRQGHYAHGVPHPVVFVVDETGVIRAKLSRESYRDRPEPEAILAAVDLIESERGAASGSR